MKCWNCGEEIEEGTKVCRRCEADQTEVDDFDDLDPVMLEETMAFMEKIAPGSLETIRELANQHGTAEDFVNALFVGPCSKCGSEKVDSCENDPDYNDPLLGRCFECGTVWCTECGYQLQKGEKECPSIEEHLAEYPDEPDFDEDDGLR
jgi:hypothetical protein